MRLNSMALKIVLASALASSPFVFAQHEGGGVHDIPRHVDQDRVNNQNNNQGNSNPDHANDSRVENPIGNGGHNADVNTQNLDNAMGQLNGQGSGPSTTDRPDHSSNAGNSSGGSSESDHGSSGSIEHDVHDVHPH